MLNGLDPIILFHFFKLTPDVEAVLNKIPLISKIADKIELVPIPIYLSERLTGLYIDSEDKNIDIQTTTETSPNGEDVDVTQKGINSTVKINLVASRNSLGITLMSAMADLIFQKVTSREYAITYMHGAITVFYGLLHSFSINQNSDNDLYNITIELSKSGVGTRPKTSLPVVEAGAPPL